MDAYDTLKLGKDIFDRWWRVGSAKGLNNDAEIANFLLEQYEKRQERLEQWADGCGQCRGPVKLLCISCQWVSACNVDVSLLQPSVSTHTGTSLREEPATADFSTDHQKTSSWPAVKRARSQLTTDDIESERSPCSYDSFSEWGPSGAVSGQDFKASDRTRSKYTDHEEMENLSLNQESLSTLKKIVETSDLVIELHDNEIKKEAEKLNVEGNGSSCHKANWKSVFSTRDGQTTKASELAAVNNKLQQVDGSETKLQSLTEETQYMKCGQQCDLNKGDQQREQTDGDRGADEMIDGTERIPNRKWAMKKQKSTQHGNKHVCPQCGLKSRSPHHLKIHLRSHTGEKPFVCDFCGRGYATSVYLAIHRRIHTGEKPYKCKECNKTFRVKEQLHTHMSIHTGVFRYVCQQCGYGCRSQTVMQKHQQVHTGETPFTCEECGKGFRQVSGLKKHWQVHHSGVKPFQCSECGAAYSNKAAWSNHIKKHQQKEPLPRNHVCELCGAAFTIPSYLRQHMLSHSEDRPHKCEKCNKAFKSVNNMKKHLKLCGKTVKREKTCMCSICGKGFTTKQSLDFHTKLHTGEYTCKCDVCGMEFVRVKSLTLHMCKVHTGVCPYVCDVCGKAFPTRGCLNNHLRAHAEKKFHCSECDARFPRKEQLKNHMVMHTGEKPFVCSVCGARFPRRHSLGIHMRLRHTGEKPYACKECHCAFALSRDLKKHKERMHPVSVHSDTLHVNS